MVQDHQIATMILDHLEIQYDEIARFNTGYCHRVYLVTSQNDKFVLRVSDYTIKTYYEGSLYWLPKLGSIGLPVPRIIRHGYLNDYYYTIITYIPGRDLGEVYTELSAGEKKQIASKLANIQQIVSKMPSEGYYGFSLGHHHNSWVSVVNDLIDRANERIKRNGIFPVEYVNTVRSHMVSLENYFSSIRPIPFLDDITTKNVLISNGKLSGIVDIDEVCYGDSIATIGLTHMALLGSKFDTEYVDYWLCEVNPTQEQRKAELFYALLYCLDFMSEQGMRFNNGTEINGDSATVNQLTSSYKSLAYMIEN